MKILLCLFMSITIYLSQSLSQEIIIESDISTLLLPNTMKQSLYRYDPDFTFYKIKDYEEFIVSNYQINKNQLPWAVIGDFNGDLIKDVVIVGHNNKIELLIAILSESDSFYVHEISRSQYFGPKLNSKWSSISYIPKGTILGSNYEDDSIDLTSDAFEWGSEKGTAIYYFKDGEFHIYVTSD